MNHPHEDTPKDDERRELWAAVYTAYQDYGPEWAGYGPGWAAEKADKVVAEQRDSDWTRKQYEDVMLKDPPPPARIQNQSDPIAVIALAFGVVSFVLSVICWIRMG